MVIMLFLLSTVLTVGSLATLGLLIAKAPEAYETDQGLRVVPRPAKMKHRAGGRLAVAQAQH